MTHVRDLLSLCFVSLSNQINPPIFFLSAGLISSSESSDGDDSDPESSNSGDSTFSEDINKMVTWIRLAFMPYSDQHLLSINRNEFSFSCQRFVLCLFQRVEPDINVKRECEEKIVHVDINIPDVLKKKLEDDCFYINKRKKVHAADKAAEDDVELIRGLSIICPDSCLLAGDGPLSDERGAHLRVLRQTLCHQQSIHGQREVPASAEHHAEQQSTASPSREEVSTL